MNKQEFDQLTKQLIVLMNEKQYSQVLDLIDKTRKNKTELDNSQLAIIYFFKGAAHSELKQYDKAIENHNKAIELDPNFADPYNGRGLVYAELKQYGKAIADFSKAIEVSPNFAKAYYNRGFVYFSIQDFENAKKDFSKALEIDRKNVVYITALQAVEDAGKIEKTSQRFETTFEEKKEEKMNKQEFKQLENQLIFLLDEKQYSQALDLIDKTRKNKTELDNTQLAIIYSFKGDVNYRMKNYEQAISDYSTAIELNPKFANPYNGCGAAHAELKQYDKAIENIDKAIELDPCYLGAYFNRGKTYLKLKRYEQAIVDFDKAIELDPNFAKPYNGRGVAYLELKQYDKAIADFNTAIELNPKFAEAYSNRGNTYLELKQYDKAIADFDKAIELDPYFAEAYYNRGVVYFSIKDFKNAKKDFRKALEIDGKNVVYINALQAAVDTEERTKSSEIFSDYFITFAKKFPKKYSKRIDEFKSKSTTSSKNHMWILIIVFILVFIIYSAIVRIAIMYNFVGWAMLPLITCATLITLPLYLIVHYSNFNTKLERALPETIQDKKDIFTLVSAIEDKDQRNVAVRELIDFYGSVNLTTVLFDTKPATKSVTKDVIKSLLTKDIIQHFTKEDEKKSSSS